MASAGEHRRTRASAAKQKLLPIEGVEQSDRAYLDAVEDAEMTAGCRAMVRWAIMQGERRDGCKVFRKRSQRGFAQVLGLSSSTVCESLRRLRESGLLTEVDGEYRLRLSWLVEISEQVRTERTDGELPPVELAAAALGGARRRSAGARTVREETNYPVTVTDTVPVGRRAAEQTEHDDRLKEDPAWCRLQTRHFRPAIQLPALRPAFDSAVRAGLLCDDYESRVRFLATCWDLATDSRIRSPAVVLRRRVERNACFRLSEEGNRWAKQQIRDPALSGS